MRNAGNPLSDCRTMASPPWPGGRARRTWQIRRQVGGALGLELLGQRVELDQRLKQWLQLFDRDHVCAVRRSLVGILMRLDEHARYADRNSCPGQHRDKFTLAP